MNRLYLVRHGENKANLTKQFSCKVIDYPLTPKGVLQAQQTAAYFRDKGIDEIYSSPLKRALETAQIIGDELGLPVTVLESLREVDVGDLERQPPSPEAWQCFGEIVQAWLAGQADRAFPGGEDYRSLCQRMRASLEQMLAGKSKRNIIAVGHGGIFTLTLPDFCRGVDADWLRRLVGVQNCAIAELRVRLQEGLLEAEIVSWDYHDHLHGAAAELVSGAPDKDSFRENG